MCSSQFEFDCAPLSLSLISRIDIPMDSNLTKVCPQCNSTVHVRRAVCKCGYAFPSKRKALSGIAMKRRRVHNASVRASETSQKTLCRQETDRVRKTSKRASETPEETMNKRESDKIRKASNTQRNHQKARDR